MTEGTSEGKLMNRAFNRRRGLRATLTLVAASAATLAVAGGSALAATHTSSLTAASCVSKASTPFRAGHPSRILGAVPARGASQAGNGAGPTAPGDPPM